ncbi:DUF1983 domain-containing protein, partial [Klebsiella pneumoniae subsp. pneumoniae]|uniref:beta strand repeat-containing protein n=1 Tax=Klebsiella pneumoniae TaxID=573 RepID=UPI000D49A6CE
LSSGGNRKASATWQRVTWRFKITQGIVDRGFFRPFLQINQSSPFGTVWFVTDWHMRNVTAAQKVQDTADATAAAVDSLTTTVTQQGNLLTSTGNRTTQLENGLATTNAAVAKKADATAVQNLTNTVTQLGNDLTAANSAITKLTGNLANTDKALAQKADATALATLDTKVTQQGKTLESQSNSLTNLSNSLSQVAADIDASGQIPGNLVVNPSFERGLDGYIGQSAAASVVETSTPHGGTRALKVDAGNVSPGQYVSFVQGRTYEIGVWVKDLGATTDNGAGNNKLRIGNSAGQPVFERPYNSGTIGSDWTLISGRWKATETAKLPVTLSNYLTAGSRCFDDFYVIDVTDSVKIDANASALSSLQNTVTQQGKDIASQSTSITSLSNQMVNGRQNMWVRSVYSVQLANNTTEPTFSDINGKAPISIDEVPDAAKLDFASAGSYVIAHYKAFVKVNADTTITMAPGSRVFDDTGAVYVNGVRVAFGNAGWNTVSFDLKAGWSTVEFLVNQWTGQAYINLGFKLSEKVAQLNSALGMNALSNAISAVTSNVSTVGDRVTSTSQSVTDLRNSLEQTNANLANKADAQALSALQNTVTQQGKDIASASSSIASLQNNLSTTNANVAKKADATALNALQNTVTSQGGDLTAANSSITSLQASMNRRTVFTVTAKGNGNSVTPGIFDESGKNLFSPGRSWALVTFAKQSDGSAVIATSKTYDVFGSANNGDTMSADIGALTSGTYVCVLTFDEPSGNRGKILSALESLGGTSEVVNSLPYRGAYILLGRKGMRSGDGLELRAPTGGDATAHISTSVEFVNGIMMGLGAAGGVMMKADANASAITTLQNTVTQQGKDITSASSDISLLKNSLATTDANVAKKADSSALSSLQSTVNQQGTSISSIGNRTTSLENGLSTAQNNIARKADASALQDLRNTVTSQGGDLTAANSSITSLQASMNRRTVFTVTAKGNGNSVTPGIFDESGKNLFSPGRSWALVTFAKQSDGSAVIATSKTYDVFGSANNGDTMSADIGALTSGTYVCVLTFDEPSGNRGKILSALESLGGTSEVVNSLPYRGAYILLGRKGMRSGDGLELRAPTGGDATAHISTSVEFVNGIMMGLGAAGGVMMKADANASAITTLQNTVKTQGGNIDSLSSSITALENSLRSTNDTVSKKADTTAVSSLTGRVSQVENTITSQSQSITSLTSTINTIRTQGANPWVDGTFESYSDGQVLGGNGTAVVVASQKFTGGKSLKLRRDENNSGNSDKQLGTWQSVREDAKFRFEFWAMMPADQAPSSGWTTLVGIQSQNAAGQNAWQAAVTVSEASLGARDKWVKFTGIASNNGAGRTRAVVWISTRGASGSDTPGYSLYIDDLVITDVTDAKAAQDASDATASAVSGLTARVTDAEGKITAQAQQQTALATKVDNANSRVDNMAKTLSDSQSTQASLNTSLQSQIDAQAAANIKNQTTLDNTIKSVASITSTQQTHATALEALATQQTTLTSSVGDLSASVQNTAKTVADVNGTVSSLWSMKVETVNGKNVGAGITLGSNGETSDMILYADRFSLFNRNNATAVPVMIAEGNELYIDTARIKNSSLTSTKIADGSITNAKIGNEIRSNDFVDGSRGWRIAKDGSSQFNNVIVRGAVYATDGWFQGTVYANHIEGDIGSFAINIAQHRTRKVPKATWQWFELARFRRQNFDQVINIRGGLLQTDSITIYGGAKLRAGMSYAPGADGGLNPGYLSYAMLLRGTGATSGGGSMELGIELMYETGGATRLLTAQESMNVDNMSFVVPAGTGDAVLRYGCYLDRNGQMVLTILSRFDAFAARNNNVIRGSST